MPQYTVQRRSDRFYPWADGGTGEIGIIDDAPLDGKLYGRQLGEWEPVVFPDKFVQQQNTINTFSNTTITGTSLLNILPTYHLQLSQVSIPVAKEVYNITINWPASVPSGYDSGAMLFTTSTVPNEGATLIFTSSRGGQTITIDLVSSEPPPSILLNVRNGQFISYTENNSGSNISTIQTQEIVPGNATLHTIQMQDLTKQIFTYELNPRIAATKEGHVVVMQWGTLTDVQSTGAALFTIPTAPPLGLTLTFMTSVDTTATTVINIPEGTSNLQILLSIKNGKIATYTTNLAAQLPPSTSVQKVTNILPPTTGNTTTIIPDNLQIILPTFNLELPPSGGGTRNLIIDFSAQTEVSMKSGAIILATTEIPSQTFTLNISTNPATSTKQIIVNKDTVALAAILNIYNGEIVSINDNTLQSIQPFQSYFLADGLNIPVANLSTTYPHYLLQSQPPVPTIKPIYNIAFDFGLSLISGPERSGSLVIHLQQAWATGATLIFHTSASTTSTLTIELEPNETAQQIIIYMQDGSFRDYLKRGTGDFSIEDVDLTKTYTIGDYVLRSPELDTTIYSGGSELWKILQTGLFSTTRAKRIGEDLYTKVPIENIENGSIIISSGVIQVENSAFIQDFMGGFAEQVDVAHFNYFSGEVGATVPIEIIYENKEGNTIFNISAISNEYFWIIPQKYLDDGTITIIQKEFDTTSSDVSVKQPMNYGHGSTNFAFDNDTITGSGTFTSPYRISSLGMGLMATELLDPIIGTVETRGHDEFTIISSGTGPAVKGLIVCDEDGTLAQITYVTKTADDRYEYTCQTISNNLIQESIVNPGEDIILPDLQGVIPNYDYQLKVGATSGLIISFDTDENPHGGIVVFNILCDGEYKDTITFISHRTGVTTAEITTTKVPLGTERIVAFLTFNSDGSSLINVITSFGHLDYVNNAVLTANTFPATSIYDYITSVDTSNLRNYRFALSSTGINNIADLPIELKQDGFGATIDIGGGQNIPTTIRATNGRHDYIGRLDQSAIIWIKTSNRVERSYRSLDTIALVDLVDPLLETIPIIEWLPKELPDSPTELTISFKEENVNEINGIIIINIRGGATNRTFNFRFRVAESSYIYQQITSPDSDFSIVVNFSSGLLAGIIKSFNETDNTLYKGWIPNSNIDFSMTNRKATAPDGGIFQLPVGSTTGIVQIGYINIGDLFIVPDGDIPRYVRVSEKNDDIVTFFYDRPVLQNSDYEQTIISNLNVGGEETIGSANSNILKIGGKNFVQYKDDELTIGDGSDTAPEITVNLYNTTTRIGVNTQDTTQMPPTQIHRALAFKDELPAVAWVDTRSIEWPSLPEDGGMVPINLVFRYPVQAGAGNPTYQTLSIGDAVEIVGDIIPGFIISKIEDGKYHFNEQAQAYLAGQLVASYMNNKILIGDDNDIENTEVGFRLQNQLEHLKVYTKNNTSTPPTDIVRQLAFVDELTTTNPSPVYAASYDDMALFGGMTSIYNLSYANVKMTDTYGNWMSAGDISEKVLHNTPIAVYRGNMEKLLGFGQIEFQSNVTSLLQVAFSFADEDYIPQEIFTGKFWFNGKKIYRRVLQYAHAYGATTNFGWPSLGIDQLIDYDGYTYGPSSGNLISIRELRHWNINPQANEFGLWQVGQGIEGHIPFINGGTSQTADQELWIEYTKV